jgi:hypothetical protein
LQRRFLTAASLPKYPTGSSFLSDRAENSQAKADVAVCGAALNLPALSDVATVVNDLVANEHPALADTIHEIALREFLAHLVIATAPNQPLQAAATHIVRQAVLSGSSNSNHRAERADV